MFPFPLPLPLPPLETCQELGSSGWVIERIKRVSHTELGFFVLHHKACCWPGYLSTLFTRKPRGRYSWQLWKQDHRGDTLRVSIIHLSLEKTYMKYIPWKKNVLCYEVFNFGEYRWFGYISESLRKTDTSWCVKKCFSSKHRKALELLEQWFSVFLMTL